RIGAVYRGYQASLSREVAIKVIHPTFTGDRAATTRFSDAARLACQLVAPSIANTYDFGHTEDGVLYTVSELVRGRSLANEAKQRTLPARRVVAIAMQVCEALEAAHRLSCVHADLKPSNIMVDDSSGRDVVNVLDFGLSRALVPESAHLDPRRGAPSYLAPEQLEPTRGPVDVRTDLYALGC